MFHHNELKGPIGACKEKSEVIFKDEFKILMKLTQSCFLKSFYLSLQLDHLKAEDFLYSPSN